MSDLFTISDAFVTATAPLEPKTAVAAIIVDEAGRVLLQLRDDRPDIFFPNHWGCFGGAIEPGETPRDTLLRELQEELGVTFDDAAIERFITISFNTKTTAKHNIDRFFFIVTISAARLKTMQLGEGRAFDFFAPADAMRIPNATPYDRFALWLYFNQYRLAD